MKTNLLLVAFYFVVLSNFAQVGIGTVTPNNASLLELQSTTQTFVPPRMTGTQMNAITSPLVGSMVYNITDDAMYLRTSQGWKSMFFINNDVILLNREFTTIGNNALATINNTYDDLPIGSTNIVINDPTTYTVIGNGRIQVLKTGVYSIVAGLSTSNLPSGNIKYILAVEVNNVLNSYLSRGIANNTAVDEFGFSGTSGVSVNANDVLRIRYVLNNSGNLLDARFINVGITRLK